MPVSVAISERILRQVRTDVAAITGIGTVVRMSAPGRWWTGSEWLDELGDTDAQVVFGGEDVISEAIGGNSAPVTKRMRVGVAVSVARPETETTPTDAKIQYWNALVEQAVMSNAQIAETATSVRLASETRLANVPETLTTQGQRESVALKFFEIDYLHERNNPFRFGTVIPLVTE